MKAVLTTLGILIAVGLLIAAGVVFSGAFNVAATVVDAAPLNWLLVNTREASVKRHASDTIAPALGGMQQREDGFRIFREACAMCHVAPGQAITSMAKGLNPQAPALVDLVQDMTDAELFWVTKNGIRFTGMPAWDSSHNNQQIWDVVAFMRTSSKVTAADYAAMDRRIPSVPVPQQ